jgi:hypothetical protein
MTPKQATISFKPPFSTFKQRDSRRRWLQIEGELQEVSRTILQDKCTEFIHVKGITAKSNFK